MAEGKKVVGLWPHRPQQIDAAAAPENAPGVAPAEITPPNVDMSQSASRENIIAASDWEQEWDAEQTARESAGSSRIFSLLLLAGTIGWASFAAYALYSEWAVQSGFLARAQSIAILSAPLCLIAAIAIWTQRSSLSETNRYGQLLRTLRLETEQLETRLAGATSYIKSSQDQLINAANLSVNHSLEAANNLQGAAHAVAAAGTEIQKNTGNIVEQTAIARRNVETVLAGLPKVDVVAQRMAENVRQAGLIAHKHGSNLEAKLAAIGDASHASSKLLIDLASDVEAKLANIVARSRDVGDQFEKDLSAKIATVETSLSATKSSADAMDGLLSGQIAKASELNQAITANIANNQDHLAAFDKDATDRLVRLSTALVTLEQRSLAAQSAMAAGTETAGAFQNKTEDVLTALDAILREIDESMPTAFARLDSKAADSRALLASIEPGLGRAEASVDSILGQLREAEALISEQSRVFDHIATHGQGAMEEQRAALSALEDGIERVRMQSDAVTQSVGPQMVEALVRVRETATQAAERAREAISGVIPETSGQMAAAVADAMENAIRGRVEEQMAAISDAAQRAVAAAHLASERLMRQMITIADTSANIERRVEEAHVHAEAAMQDNLAKTLSLLTDALNSTAIDVTALLSTDIADTAWESYLRGDKGVFTRRAVKLLGNSEAKEVLRRYETDDAFRNHVNRYIHDFEAMLKSILNLREGQSISVTLLSSDIGKLYVALAQAIDRLRV